MNTASKQSERLQVSASKFNTNRNMENESPMKTQRNDKTDKEKKKEQAMDSINKKLKEK